MTFNKKNRTEINVAINNNNNIIITSFMQGFYTYIPETN